jgi:hypothetical protein
MTASLDDSPQIDFAHPANTPVLRFLGVPGTRRARTTARSEVNMLALGTHPDLVEYLWRLGAALPRACACVIDERSYPLLVHPVSSVIFALAGGTSTLAFRLPARELAPALEEPGFGREYRYPGSTVRAADIGPDWALVRPYGDRNAERCTSAFTYAADFPHGTFT